LLLATAQPVAALTYHGIVAFRQRGDEIVNVGRAAGRFQVGLACIGAGIEEVSPNRIVKQISLLGDHADLLG